ncbi:MAG: threonine synthase, partial [Spirochaetaceae bacterium]|nr:threonine synthase [Spirochaetaceae bacterium]
MRYYSTRSASHQAGYAQAALAGLAPDGGLFVPEEIPSYPRSVLSSLGSMEFPDIAFETIRPYVHPEIPDAVLGDMVRDAYPFGAPLVTVGDRFMLELFHGPTAAFKDFGARFMARSFSYLRRGESKPLSILVATSGDTGGAVADGFFGVQGISVTVLYPKGRVTPLQEKQIAGLKGNIKALAVEGSFDDCQALVKAAFADQDLQKHLTLSSANSINISRLIPQAAYYAAAAGRAASGRSDPDGEATPRVAANGASGRRDSTPVRRDSASGGKGDYYRGLIVSVPSGNFGNLTAGLYAKAMGAPIALFIAATNINKTVPDYLANGDYRPRPSQATISNAMDVGAPSNFERMASHWSYDELRKSIQGVWVSDEATRETIRQVRCEAAYFLDPHGAVGWRGADELTRQGGLPQCSLAILGTAHPAKFIEVVEPLAG